MSIFHAIAAMSENRVIGKEGKIPWHLPEEYRWFKHRTMGGTLIMGRTTYESIGEPLPGRKTIVLTRQATPIDGVEICADAGLLIKKLTDERASQPGALWICGGVQVYRRFLPECLSLYLTRVKRTVEGDAFFPEFEDDFSLEQVIHENQAFRVEHWFRKGLTHDAVNEPWPFATPKA
ncbi:MAG: dihydrofolate reductase [Methylacidiphilales bacterium]|nr:dihydrofolate reductase [Candidatus Methylacidiphilales bacterium]